MALTGPGKRGLQIPYTMIPRLEYLESTSMAAARRVESCPWEKCLDGVRRSRDSRERGARRLTRGQTRDDGVGQQHLNEPAVGETNVLSGAAGRGAENRSTLDQDAAVGRSGSSVKPLAVLCGRDLALEARQRRCPRREASDRRLGRAHFFVVFTLRFHSQKGSSGATGATPGQCPRATS